MTTLRFLANGISIPPLWIDPHSSQETIEQQVVAHLTEHGAPEAVPTLKFNKYTSALDDTLRQQQRHIILTEFANDEEAKQALELPLPEPPRQPTPQLTELDYLYKYQPENDGLYQQMRNDVEKDAKSRAKLTSKPQQKKMPHPGIVELQSLSNAMKDQQQQYSVVIQDGNPTPLRLKHIQINNLVAQMKNLSNKESPTIQTLPVDGQGITFENVDGDWSAFEAEFKECCDLLENPETYFPSFDQPIQLDQLEAQKEVFQSELSTIEKACKESMNAGSGLQLDKQVLELLARIRCYQKETQFKLENLRDQYKEDADAEAGLNRTERGLKELSKRASELEQKLAMDRLSFKQYQDLESRELDAIMDQILQDWEYPLDSPHCFQIPVIYGLKLAYTNFLEQFTVRNGDFQFHPQAALDALKALKESVQPYPESSKLFEVLLQTTDRVALKAAMLTKLETVDLSSVIELARTCLAKDPPPPTPELLQLIAIEEARKLATAFLDDNIL